MKLHTNDFKNALKAPVRELDSIITYTFNNEQVQLGVDDINSINCITNGNILKSVMKQLEIDSNVEIPKGVVLNYQFGLKVNGEYEYLNMGNYIVDKIEKLEDTNSYKITCYDKMLYSMVEYDEINISYPTTVRSYLSAICQKLGITFKDENTQFVNYNKPIAADLYKELKYTYRDVLDEIAQVTASTICINEEDDELEVRYVNNTNDEINEDYLKNVNVKFEEKYGPINTIVFSRSADADKISQSIPENLPDSEKKAIEIRDNQILNFNNRDIFMPEILNELNGLEYYMNDFLCFGIGYYNVCDKYNIVVGENTYPCVFFNSEFAVTQGIEENIYTEMPEGAETDYTKTDKTDNRINQTYLIVDKQNQTIESVVSNVTEQDEKISQITQTVDEINSKISDVADLTTSGEAINASLQLEGINASEPVTLKIHPIGSNITYLYPNTNLYPSDDLFMTTRTVRFHNETTGEDFDLELPDDLLYYDENTYDEFTLDYGDGVTTKVCQILHKCVRNSSGEVHVLSSPYTTDYPYITRNLTDGDYTISILNYTYGYIFARLMTQNIYTTQFYTKAETNTKISQSATDINLSVDSKLSNYSTTQEMNTAINLSANAINAVVENNNTKANIIAKINDNTSSVQIDADNIDLSGQTINLTSDNIAITSTNFSVNKDGDILAKSGTFSGNIKIESSEGLPNPGQNNKMELYNNTSGLNAKLYPDVMIFSHNDDVYSGRTVITRNIVLCADSDYMNAIGSYTEMTPGTIFCYNYDIMTDVPLRNQTVLYPTFIKTPELIQTSSVNIKKNFEKFENGIDIIKNIDIYKYNLKTEKDDDKKHLGFVIGDGYNYSQEVTSQDNENVDLYSFTSLCCQCIKEQQEIIEDLQKRIEKLERESDK